jgi:hypothetical protein
LGKSLLQRSPEHYSSHQQTPFDHTTAYAAVACTGKVGLVAFPLGQGHDNQGFRGLSAGLSESTRSVPILIVVISLGALGAGDAPEEELRPDPNGSRLRALGRAPVYVIDKGFRRAVPKVPVYEALCRDWECIIDDIDPESIRLGDSLGDNSSLVRLAGQPAVYFIDGTTRRHVASPQVMDKYRFAGERVREVTADELNKWPEGSRLP